MWKRSGASEDAEPSHSVLVGLELRVVAGVPLACVDLLGRAVIRANPIGEGLQAGFIPVAFGHPSGRQLTVGPNVVETADTFTEDLWRLAAMDASLTVHMAALLVNKEHVGREPPRLNLRLPS
jgi:hypothetical protein